MVWRERIAWCLGIVASLAVLAGIVALPFVYGALFWEWLVALVGLTALVVAVVQVYLMRPGLAVAAGTAEQQRLESWRAYYAGHGCSQGAADAYARRKIRSSWHWPPDRQ